MCTVTHINEHIAQHSKAGQGISMLQLICSLTKIPLLLAVPWGMKEEAMAISH